jgi:sec-independent protein translocase protein TatB
MPSLSPLELVTVAVIALVVFGPNKLPEFARNIGQFLAQMRRVSDDLRSEFSSGMSDFSVQDEPDDEDETVDSSDRRDVAPEHRPAETDTPTEVDEWRSDERAEAVDWQHEGSELGSRRAPHDDEGAASR